MEGTHRAVDSAPCMVTLWHASGTDVPASLLSALSGAKTAPGSVRVRVVCDPYMALAELCRVRGTERAAIDSKGATSARLVMVYPELLTDAAELCRAADTYAPGVPRWQFGPASNPTLRPIVEDDVARWSGRSASPVVVVQAAVESAVSARSSRTVPMRPMAGPQLRLAGEGPGLSASEEGPGALDNLGQVADGERLAGGGAAPSPSKSGPLITDEELRMLLGEHHDEGREER